MSWHVCHCMVVTGFKRGGGAQVHHRSSICPALGTEVTESILIALLWEARGMLVSIRSIARPVPEPAATTAVAWGPSCTICCIDISKKEHVECLLWQIATAHACAGALRQNFRHEAADAEPDICMPWQADLRPPLKQEDVASQRRSCVK